MELSSLLPGFFSLHMLSSHFIHFLGNDRISSFGVNCMSLCVCECMYIMYFVNSSGYHY